MQVIKVATIKFLSKFLSIIHLAIVVFVIFGCLLPNRSVILFHLIFLPILVLHWKTNEGVCYLTQLENKIQGKKSVKTDMRGGFTENLFMKLFGKQPTRLFLQSLIYTIMSLSWMISIIKYLN